MMAGLRHRNQSHSATYKNGKHSKNTFILYKAMQDINEKNYCSIAMGIYGAAYTISGSRF